MSNNDDIDNDLDVEDFDDTGFDDFTQKGSLGDLWRNNPMVKIGVILAGFAVVVGAIILFGGSDPSTNVSRVSSGSTVTEAPGTSEVSETMRESLEQANIQRVEDASRTGGSAIPIPIDPPKGTLPLQLEQESGEDPLERWRRMQEERIRQQETIAQTRPSQQEAAPPVDTRTPVVNALSQTMVSQMQAVLQNQRIPGVQHKNITGTQFLEAVENKKLQQFERQQRQMLAIGNQANADVIENIFLPAGTIEYGQLLIEANTDAPGPVLAQIVSGPLRGSRVLGAFQSTQEYITLNFNQVVIDGINYSIRAVAIDPNTTLPGMVTEIDRRYFSRIVLPVAASFITGLARAVGDSGTTQVLIGNDTTAVSTFDRDTAQEIGAGIAEAGDVLGDLIDEEARRIRPMLRIAPGTPIGIFFINPVTDLAQAGAAGPAPY